MNLTIIYRPLARDLALDLGTANTLIYGKGEGIVVNEPSVVAVNRRTGGFEAAGTRACAMLGRMPPKLLASYPLRSGAIADPDMAELMLRHFFARANGRRLLSRARVTVAAPGRITEVERRAVLESAARAGAAEVSLVPNVIAAAHGAGLPVAKPSASMIADIGAGVTEVAVISLSGIVHSQAVPAGGDAMDSAIVEHMHRVHQLLIGLRTAEQIKIQLGSALPLASPLAAEVKGRCLVRGMPREVTVNDEEIREALSRPVDVVVAAVRSVLERTPPELSGDLTESGIVLTGGVALLRNLDRRIGAETGLPVSIAPEPLLSVVRGLEKMLNGVW